MGTNITSIGITANGIGFNSRVAGGGKYLSPELKNALCGVWIADQNTNNSPNRNIIKNKLKDRGGDFEILNAAYKLNSGYGLYQFDWSTWSSDSGVAYGIKITKEHNKVTYSNGILGCALNLYKDGTFDTTKIKIKVSDKDCIVQALYKNVGSSSDEPYITAYQKKGLTEHTIEIPPNRIIDFVFSNFTKDSFTVEQIPEYKGAFVTDGVDDMIISQKSVSEMLDRKKELTAVSFIVSLEESKEIRSNFYGTSTTWNENDIAKNTHKKSGVFGYTITDYTTNKGTMFGPFLGDKQDYTYRGIQDNSADVGVFSPVGFISKRGVPVPFKAAWYWTVIANKVLTEDEINQVIAYYNLDKYVTPDVYYNVKKQGLTNDNHAEFGDKLIDYSGNGHDMQLYNIAWEGNSGVNNYPVVFGRDKTWRYIRQSGDSSGYETEINTTAVRFTKINSSLGAIYSYVKTDGALVPAWNVEYPSFRVKITGLSNYPDIVFRYSYFETENSIIRSTFVMRTDGIYTIPKSYKATEAITGDNVWIGFSFASTPLNVDCDIEIEVLPENEGALALDGVDDFGKVEELPILKDYTVIADREVLNKDSGTVGSILSKSKKNQSNGIEYGAFIFEMSVNNYSFNYYPTNIGNNNYNKTRTFSYLSKYLYNGKTVNVGTATDSNTMWLGTIRDSDPRFSNLALYSAMLFPYSLSKFLIERQLKRHKLGSFYEKDMIPFRPEVTSNIPYNKIVWFTEDWKRIDVGDYIPTGSTVKANLYLIDDIDEVSKITSNQGTATFSKSTSIDPHIWDLVITNIKKQPVKIDITIDKYIRFEHLPTLYPLFITWQDKDGKNEYSWGSKIKLDEYDNYRIKVKTITNLLPELYRANSYYIDNNGNWISNASEEQFRNFIFDKSNLLQSHVNFEYLLDDNEPKCILSPERFKIPLDSYKILGYVPDISRANYYNGVLNNFALTEESGFDSKGILNFDGVDDFIKIDNASAGGKQVLMKFIYEGNGSLAYDQRNGGIDDFAIYVGSNTTIAHNFRNSGETYIDGVLNKFIKSSDLSRKLHNATVINDININTQSATPVIGSNRQGADYYTKMSLYTFMLFDEISTPDKIKELNEIVGIEGGYVQKPPYYWDAYGKSNDDSDRDVLVNKGTAGSGYDLTLSNFAFEGMSGYGGYPVVFGNNKTWKTFANNVNVVYTYNSTQFNVTKSSINVALLVTGIRNGDNIVLNKEIPSFTIKVTGVSPEMPLRYRYLATENAQYTVKFDITSDGIHTLPKCYTVNPDTYIDTTTWIGWHIPYTGNCNITVEILPDYPNGLAMDGVDDNLRNLNLPEMSDYTCIIKRMKGEDQIGGGSTCLAYKGSNMFSGGRKNAFIAEYGVPTSIRATFYSYSNSTSIPRVAEDVLYFTPTDYSGTPVQRGEGIDTPGLQLGKWDSYWQGIFYKLILFPKNIDNLSLNMLRNMVSGDGVIDLTHRLFTDKFNGDFNNDFNIDFLIGNK